MEYSKQHLSSMAGPGEKGVHHMGNNAGNLNNTNADDSRSHMTRKE